MSLTPNIGQSYEGNQTTNVEKQGWLNSANKMEIGRPL